MLIADKNNQSHDQLIFHGALCLMLILSLWPIWQLSFLPMQDYPQHIFLAKVLSTFSDPAYNWPQHYKINLQYGPYSFFYLFCKIFSKYFPVDTTGRLFLSLYIVLTGITIASLPFFSTSNRPPWAGLLLFPVSFHQIYFMGFTNYLVSIPILLLTIFDFHRFCSQKKRVLSFLRHLFHLALLFLCHPYTILVYICLAAMGALFSGKQCKFRHAALSPLACILFFTFWYNTFLPANSSMPILWWPWQKSASYYFLLFNNMQPARNINWQSFLPWLAVIIILSVSFSKTITTEKAIAKRITLYFSLTTIGFFVLPFWAGQYSYFNLRLAPLSYAFAIILASTLNLSRKSGLSIFTLAFILTLSSINLQSKIAREINTLEPVLNKMRPNARLLPITFQTASNILDNEFFPEFHAHDYFYYHVLIGGGVSPYLFPSPMLPVQFKADTNLPKAIHDFSWQEHGSAYDYIITRHAPKAFQPFIMRHATFVAKSGDWLLFENNLLKQ